MTPLWFVVVVGVFVVGVVACPSPPTAIACDDDDDCGAGLVCRSGACVANEGEGEGEEGEGEEGEGEEGEGEEGEGEGDEGEGEGEGEGDVGTALTQLQVASSTTMTNAAQTTTLSLRLVDVAPVALRGGGFVLVVDGATLAAPAP